MSSINFSFFTLFLIFLYLDSASVNGATFNNVNVTLSMIPNYGFIPKKDRRPPKLVEVQSDDSLSKYVDNSWDIVTIRNQMVPTLKTHSLADMPNVVRINVIRSGLQSIEPGAFYRLPKVKVIDLFGNRLEEIKNGIFQELPKLMKLNLARNMVHKLGDQVFNNIPTLRHIFIDHNRISEWRNHWFSGSPVESISMSHNLVKSLPARAFDYFVEMEKGKGDVKLWYLVLNDNKLNFIDPNAFEGLNEILYLNLQNNSIDYLPAGLFRTVKYINNLQLNSNSIVDINVGKVFKNTELTYVELQNNRLKCLPFDFVDVTKAYGVNLTGNPLACECARGWSKKQKEIRRKGISFYVDLGDNLGRCKVTK